MYGVVWLVALDRLAFAAEFNPAASKMPATFDLAGIHHSEEFFVNEC